MDLSRKVTWQVSHSAFVRTSPNVAKQAEKLSKLDTINTIKFFDSILIVSLIII